MKKKIILLLSTLIMTAFCFTGCMYIDGGDNQWHSWGPNCDNPNYTGMDCNEWGWWYFQNGVIDWHYTGMACNDWGWWYFNNGQLDWNYTGMACNMFGWWYYRNGQIDWNYTGFGQNMYGYWLYRNGNIDFNYTGDWNGYYIKGGHFENGFNGILNERIYVNGVRNDNYTGLANIDNKLYFFKNGKEDLNYYGIQAYNNKYYIVGPVGKTLTGAVITRDNRVMSITEMMEIEYASMYLEWQDKSQAEVLSEIRESTGNPNAYMDFPSFFRIADCHFNADGTLNHRHQYDSEYTARFSDGTVVNNASCYTDDKCIICGITVDDLY